MRVSPASLTLLLGSTVAFAPFVLNRADFHSSGVSRRRNSHSALYNNVPTTHTLLPIVATQTPSLTPVKIENMKEAKRCLQQIEASATKAREYLIYLNEVAQIVRSYLQDQATPLRANFLETERQNVQEAEEYLVNIEKATASAIEYLEYLENMTSDIKRYLHKFQTEKKAGNVSDQKVQQAQEAKTYLNDLEETAQAAKDYLAYLQTVADVVQQYLVDPNLKGIQEFLPNLAENLTPPPAMQSLATTPVMPVPAVTSTTLIETVQNTATPPIVTRQSTPLETLRPQQRLKPPPARPLEVDDMIGPCPVQRIDRPEGTYGVDYLKSLRSSTAPSTTVSDTNLNYLESLASQPRTNGVVPTKPVESYLDTIAPSMQTKTIATKREIVSTVERDEAYRKQESEKKAQKEAEKRVEKALEVQQYLDDLQAQYLENLEATARAAKEHLAYLKSVDPIVRAKSSMPVLETPTHHFSKTFADSTPYSEATPVERGRSDVSHMDQMDDAILNGAAPLPTSHFEAISEKCDANKPSEPCGVAITNYLDALSSNQVAPSPVTGAVITSYLDSLSRKSLVGTSTSAAAVTSYLDGLFSGSIASPKSSAAVTSYLEAISSGSEATPSDAGAIKSYLDALSSGSTSAGSSVGAGVPSYTDTLNGAAPTLETPTRHFHKGFADSTPYSEAGPPEKGRSDVSHMDQMDDTGDEYMDEIGSIPSPTVESPTQHFSKGFADSTPYSEAGPRNKGRSDVSHMDRIDDAGVSYLDSFKTPATSQTGSFSKGYSKPAAGASTFGKGYLDTMGSPSSEPIDWSSAKGKPIVIGDATPSTCASLDQSSPGSSQSIKRATPTKKIALGSDSYLDQMQSASEPIDWSRFTEASKANAAAATTGSYMDQLSFGSNQPERRAPASKKIVASSSSYLDETPVASESIDWSSAAGKSPNIATRSATSYLEQIMASSQKGVPINLSRAPKKVPLTGSYLQSTRRGSATSGAPQYFYLEEGVKKFFFSKLDPVKGASVKTKREALLGSKYMDQLVRAARNNPRLSGVRRGSLQPEWYARTNSGDEFDELSDNNANDTQSQLDGVEKDLESEFGSSAFAEFAELINGRVAMFFLIFGLLVETFTGLTFPVQVVTIVQSSQVKDRYEQLAKISVAARQLAQSRIDAAIQTYVQKPEIAEKAIEAEQGSVEMAQELLKSSEAIQQLAQPEVDAAAQGTVQKSAPDVPEKGAEKVAEASQSSMEIAPELAESSGATPLIAQPGEDTDAAQTPAPNVPQEVAEKVAEASRRSGEMAQELAESSGTSPPIAQPGVDTDAAQTPAPNVPQEAAEKLAEVSQSSVEMAPELAKSSAASPLIAQPGVDTGAAQTPAPDVPQEDTEKEAEVSLSNVEMAQEPAKSPRTTLPVAKPGVDTDAAQNPAPNVPQKVAENAAEASQGSAEVTQATEPTSLNLDDLTF